MRQLTRGTVTKKARHLHRWRTGDQLGINRCRQIPKPGTKGIVARAMTQNMLKIFNRTQRAVATQLGSGNSGIITPL